MLGIDVGSYSIKIAVTKGSGQKVSVNKFVQEVIPYDVVHSEDPQVKQRFVSDFVSRVGMAEKSAAISIPTSAAILKNIDLPVNLNDQELEGEIQLALINLVPFPLDQVYIDFVSLGAKKSNREMQEVLVAVSRKAIVDTAADCVKSKAIKNKFVDIEAIAIGALIENIKGKNYQDVYAVIDIGLNTTNVYIYANNELLFSREQQIGGHQLTEAISDALEVSLGDAERTKLQSFGTISPDIIDGYIEAFVEQINLAFELYGSTNDRLINGVYLTGGGSNVAELIPAVKSSLGNQSVEILPISNSLKIVDKDTTGLVDTLSAVSVGLALRV